MARILAYLSGNPAEPAPLFRLLGVYGRIGHFMFQPTQALRISPRGPWRRPTITVHELVTVCASASPVQAPFLKRSELRPPAPPALRLETLTRRCSSSSFLECPLPICVAVRAGADATGRPASPHRPPALAPFLHPAHFPPRRPRPRTTPVPPPRRTPRHAPSTPSSISTSVAAARSPENSRHHPDDLGAQPRR